jgi:probable phosphoglycerate mutase
MMEIPMLRNRYFGLRHGQSHANRQQVIVSNPVHGARYFGLTKPGKHQVLDNIRRHRQLDSSTVIFCSQFRRAVQTADIARDVLGTHARRIDPRLNERWFGDLDMQDNSGYERVWRQDSLDSSSGFAASESARSVVRRMVDFVEDMESRLQAKTILIVSHGDPLQLLQTWFEGIPAESHRTLKPWQPAEIRPFDQHPE